MLDLIRNRLYLKMAMIILLLISLFSGSISLLLYQRSVLALESEAYGRLEQMVESYANKLDIEISNTMQITDTLGTLIQEDFNMERLNREPGYLDGQIQRVSPYVKVIAQDFSLAKSAYVYYNWELDGNVHDIYYVDNDNNGTVSRQEKLPAGYFTGPLSERGSKAWWFGPIQSRKGYWSPPYKWVFDDGSSGMFLSYTRAVFKDGVLIGVVGTDLKYENLVNLTDAIKVYDTGYSFLLNGDKSFLIHPVLEGKSLAELTQQPFKTLREEIPFKNKGAIRFTERDGKTWFVAYHRLRNDWTLGLAAPVSEVTESAGEITLLFIGILGISIPLICIAAFFAARQVTVPIRELTETVQKIEAGDYSPHIRSRILERGDELGKLARAIQTMGFSLENTQSDVARIIPGGKSEITGAGKEDK